MVREGEGRGGSDCSESAMQNSWLGERGDSETAGAGGWENLKRNV